MLNLLPAKFESVQGLKIYNRDFAQTRELTFALVCQPNDADRLEEFAPIFAERLPQPTLVHSRPEWFADGDRRREFPTSSGIAVPLLLNLEPRLWKRPSPFCNPTKCRRDSLVFTRKSRPARPGPSSNLQLDPLGVVTPALKPFAGNASLQEGPASDFA